MTASVIILKIVFCQLRWHSWSLCINSVRCLFLECSNFAQASQVAIRLAEFSCKKVCDMAPAKHGSYGPPTETNIVHVVVLDSLPSREVIIDQGGANSRDLIGADGSTNAAATNRNSAL